MIGDNINRMMSAEEYQPQADGFPEKFCLLQNAEGAKAHA